MARRPDNFRGLDLTSPLNRIPPGKVAMAVNTRAYIEGGVTVRNALDSSMTTVDNAIHTIQRLNDTTPAGPPSGYSLVIGTDSGSIFNWEGAGPSTKVASGLTGNPVSIVPFRPNTAINPWAYIGDDAPYPNVLVDSGATLGFPCTGMIKVRSDGLSRKMGIAEPQDAPLVTFPGGGGGPSQIYYYFTYYASETGAESNPSPVSIPGTNSQSNPSAQQVAATGGVINTNVTVNASQYEGNGAQIRTKGISSGILTDPIVCRFPSGFTIPTGVTIDGVQIDLNWLGQNSGTGVIDVAFLSYLGNPIGNSKQPGIANQSFATDALIGSSGDTWGATLTPDIINDPTFGFGVQILTQQVGSTNRSFINYFKITVYYSTQNADITPTPSPDPQVDKINFYRQGGGLANPTYVGTGPNSATVFNDKLSDLAAATNRQLNFFNYEPVPSIDLPRSGVLDAASNVLTWVSGDQFNTRWLPGTIILIGNPTQVAYIAVRRPTSSTVWNFVNNDPTVNAIPDGTNLIWNIAEPDLAAQPIAYIAGPTDNINFAFGVGDLNRPGVLYWCAGSNLDAWPDTNQLDVTDPSEPLINVVLSGGIGVLHSIRRAWFIYPNFFNALATVTGTQGSTWTLQATSINRGLFIPRCLAVEGGGNYFFRVDDGIHYSRGGAASQSITDDDLYPLFVHEGSTPQPVTRNGITIYPPDDSKPEKQKFKAVNGYLYYDHIATDGERHTWVFDIRAQGWIWDTYTNSSAPTAHAMNEGESEQGTLVGCLDTSVRLMTSRPTETISSLIAAAAIGGQGWMTAYEVTIEYSAQVGALLSFVAADEGNSSYAPNAITLPSTAGQITKYTTKVSPSKWKLLQAVFTTTDPSFQIYFQGTVMSVKPWGAEVAFKSIRLFAASGGEGPQA